MAHSLRMADADFVLHDAAQSAERCVPLPDWLKAVLSCLTEVVVGEPLQRDSLTLAQRGRAMCTCVSWAVGPELALVTELGGQAELLRSTGFGGHTFVNKYGAVLYAPDNSYRRGAAPLHWATQLFQNGDYGILKYILVPFHL
jgi:hypothetical protein